MAEKFNFDPCTLVKKARTCAAHPQKNPPSFGGHCRMAQLQLPGKLIYME